METVNVSQCFSTLCLPVMFHLFALFVLYVLAGFRYVLFRFCVDVRVAVRFLYQMHQSSYHVCSRVC